LQTGTTHCTAFLLGGVSSAVDFGPFVWAVMPGERGSQLSTLRTPSTFSSEVAAYAAKTNEKTGIGLLMLAPSRAKKGRTLTGSASLQASYCRQITLDCKQIIFQAIMYSYVYNAMPYFPEKMRTISDYILNLLDFIRN
jgi:hypothetical protein